MTLILQIYLFLSAFCLDLYVTSLLWFCLSLFCFLKIKKKLSYTILFFITLIPISVIEWNNNVDNFNLKSQNKEYSILNISGVYNLTFIMSSLGALSGYPETGFEMIYFALPKNIKKEEIHISSDFALKSSKIRGYIIKHIKSNKQKSSYNLVWARSEHSTDSSRVALALNGASVLTISNKKDNKGKLYYHCQIKTNFHMNDIGTKINVGKYTILKIEEGVFSGMQKIDAFTPYIINWTWDISDKESVLNHSNFLWIDDLIESVIIAKK